MIKKYFFLRLFNLVFAIGLVCSYFMPLFSFDTFVEYKFNYGYTDPYYEATYEPITAKISPFKITRMLFVKTNSFKEVKDKYDYKYNILNEKYLSGKYTKEEFNRELASSSESADYFLYRVYFNDAQYEKLCSKFTTYSLFLFIIYFIFLIYLVVNIINFIAPKSILFTANYQVGYVLAVLYTIQTIFIFTFYLTTTTSLLSGRVVQTTIVCGSANILLFVLLGLTIAISTVEKLINKNIQLDYYSLREIPDIVMKSKVAQKRKSKRKRNTL